MSDAAPDAEATPDRDPAAVAAARPERDVEDGDPIHAVGVGPGTPAHLTRRAAARLRDADVVVGFETVVDVVRDETDAALLSCGYDDQDETLAAFADRTADGAAGVAVLMGDPNHSGYQFLGRVEAAVDRSVRVVPGVSALQVAASRARTPMEATTFVTLHKRGSLDAALERLRAAVGDRHLLVLPRPYDWMPEDVAAHLRDAGADPALDALVLERLTLPDERITRTTLGDLAARASGSAGEGPFSDLSVLAVRR